MKSPAATRVAGEAGAAEPSDADALPRRPGADLAPYGVDDTGDLMAWDAGIGRGHADLGHHIAVADAAGFDAYTDVERAGLGDLALDELEIGAAARNLECCRLGHTSVNRRAGPSLPAGVGQLTALLSAG